MKGFIGKQKVIFDYRYNITGTIYYKHIKKKIRMVDIEIIMENM